MKSLLDQWFTSRSRFQSIATNDYTKPNKTELDWRSYRWLSIMHKIIKIFISIVASSYAITVWQVHTIDDV